MIKNATALVVLCENLFGVGTDAVEKGIPSYKYRSIEAGKINKAMAKDPSRVTLANLELAANYCFEKRLTIKSPYGLIHKIDEALQHAVAPELESDLSVLTQRALMWEAGHSATDQVSQEWISRLTRAHGDARADVLKEWKEAGRGD